jgi:hypothetical protein
MERMDMNLVDVLHSGKLYLQRLMYGEQIGRALLHLAAQQPSYYFMDLKPRNILVSFFLFRPSYVLPRAGYLKFGK